MFRNKISYMKISLKSIIISFAIGLSFFDCSNTQSEEKQANKAVNEIKKVYTLNLDTFFFGLKTGMTIEEVEKQLKQRKIEFRKTVDLIEGVSNVVFQGNTGDNDVEGMQKGTKVSFRLAIYFTKNKLHRVDLSIRGKQVAKACNKDENDLSLSWVTKNLANYVTLKYRQPTIKEVTETQRNRYLAQGDYDDAKGDYYTGNELIQASHTMFDSYWWQNEKNLMFVVQQSSPKGMHECSKTGYSIVYLPNE